MKGRISPETLALLVRCDADAGKVFWIPRAVEWFRATPGRTAKDACAQWNARFANKEAFVTIGGNGYRYGRIFGLAYSAHRVIWALVHGQWPPDQIDHINGDKLDNRLVNLREATHAQNQQNRGPNSKNTSGAKGVHWCKRHKAWEAKIRAGGRTVYLGNHKTREAASAAYAKASAELHGQYGRSR